MWSVHRAIRNAICTDLVFCASFGVCLSLVTFGNALSIAVRTVDSLFCPSLGVRDMFPVVGRGTILGWTLELWNFARYFSIFGRFVFGRVRSVLLIGVTIIALGAL